MTDEDRIQLSICQFLEWAAPVETLWHSIPNGLPSRARTVNRFKKLGLRVGAGDLIIIVRGKAHYLEVKTPTGQQSTSQRIFQMRCEAAGVDYKIARSFEEAKTILSEWGALKRNEHRRAA